MDLYYCQQYTRIPFYLHSHQHLLSLVFLITAILTGMRWYLIVVLIYLYLMCCDLGGHKESDTTERLNWTDWWSVMLSAKYLFLCLLATCKSSSGKSIFRSSSHLKIFYLCILFFGCVGSSLLCGLFSSCSEWGSSLAEVRRLLIGGFSGYSVWPPGCEGFSSCSVRTLEFWHEDAVVSVPGL